MKMTNKEMIENHNNLDAFQVKEKTYYSQRGENLLKGRIKISYAIEKNKCELRRELKPYDKLFESLVKEYRNTEAEQAAIKEEEERAEKEGRAVREISIIMNEGKDMGEYLRKLNELRDLEVEVEGIRTVSISEFDGLNLDSSDLRPFIFMLDE